MKSSKILAVGALAFALAANAQATTTIRIGGSSAYRAAAVPAIRALLNSPVNQAISSDGSGDATAANAVTITGTLKDDLTDGSGTTLVRALEPMIIMCSWTGSAGGLDNVANTSISTTRQFIKPTVSGASVDMTVGSNLSTTDYPDIAFTDAWKTSPGIDFVDNTDLLQVTSVDPVGVIPFKWVAAANMSNASALTNITNMTSQLVRAIAPAGKIKREAFSGVVGDTTMVTLTGRDPDSGTRIAALGEAGYSAATDVVQYVAATNATTMWDGKTGIPDRLIKAPKTTLNHTHDFNNGNSGFASGGTLAAAVKATMGTNIVVTYLGFGDAATALKGDGVATVKPLTYNGVPFSVAAVENGQYTFWSYEHIYYRASDAQTSGAPTAYVGAFAEALATQAQSQVTDTTGPGKYINVNDMNVTRSDDAEVVAPN